MNVFDIYLIVSTILLIIAGVIITSNRPWIALLAKTIFNLTAITGAAMLVVRMGWLG